MKFFGEQLAIEQLSSDQSSEDIIEETDDTEEKRPFEKLENNDLYPLSLLDLSSVLFTKKLPYFHSILKLYVAECNIHTPPPERIVYISLAA